MGFFDFLKPKAKSNQIEISSIKTSIEISDRPSNIEIARNYDKHLLAEGLSLGCIVLLWWSDGKSQDAYIPQYFLYDYYINANNEFKKLFDKELLRWSTPKEHLDKLKVVELKEILEKNGLPISGRKKAELIERIKTNLTDDVLYQYVSKKVYKVTDSGKVLLDKYANIIWGHKNKSKDGTINAFTFEKVLDVSPSEYSISILEGAFVKDIKNHDFGLACNHLNSISKYKNGDLDTLLQAFCIEISGLQNFDNYVAWYGYYPYLAKLIKVEITKNDLNEIQIEKRLKQAWEKCYRLFPISIVNKDSDALDLLFLALDENKDQFDLLMNKLYKKVPSKFKLAY